MIKKGGIIAVAVSGISISLLGLGYVVMEPVKKEVIIEVGEAVPSGEAFLRWHQSSAELVTKDTIQTTQPGSYDVELQIGNKLYPSTLVVRDTVAPVGKVVTTLSTDYGQEVLPETFVSEIQDATAVKVAYEKVPDFYAHDNQQVVIQLEDTSGNKTTYTSELQLRRVHDSVYIEVGTEQIEEANFFTHESIEGTVKTDLTQIPLDQPKDYEVTLVIDEGETREEVKTQLKVVDTVVPEVTTEEQTIYLGEEVTASAFVTAIQDETEVSIAYKTTPDFAKVGEQIVVLAGTDAGGNQVICCEKLKILQDTTPPVLDVPSDVTVTLGEKVAFRKVAKVTDDLTKNVKLDIDTSEVNLEKEGSYVVTFKAVDDAGNEIRRQVNYHVKKKTTEQTVITREVVDQKADEVLAHILKEGMTKEQQAKAIYTWTRSNIRYVDYSDKSDWLKAAHQGMTKRSGDCYVYFATAQALLSRVGIENQGIVKKNGGHYWSLINCGSGWYHFDATPRRGGGDFFMLTDKELEAYSVKHKNSHIFDKSKYPETPES